MRLALPILISLVLPAVAMGQGSPPMDPAQVQPQQQSVTTQGTPPVSPESGPMREVKKLVRQQLNHAMASNSFPAIDQWHPLTTKEKFQVFKSHTYSPSTFAAAGVDTTRDEIWPSSHEYETGTMGFAQRYGIELATSETDVFFERFLIPSLLKQDPRYFRNPDLPFFRRTLYAMSRVLITRADSGHDTFNASRVLGGAASQALSDLYVPGKQQGLRPVRDRVVFDLLRDSGFNLLHEFWPDLRRKLFHR